MLSRPQAKLAAITAKEEERRAALGGAVTAGTVDGSNVGKLLADVKKDADEERETVQSIYTTALSLLKVPNPQTKGNMWNTFQQYAKEMGWDQKTTKAKYDTFIAERTAKVSKEKLEAAQKKLEAFGAADLTNGGALPDKHNDEVADDDVAVDLDDL